MVVFGASWDAPGSILEGFWERRAWFWRSKTTIFIDFCTQRKQHCANAPTLTKLWQGQQKSRFFHIVSSARTPKKQYKIAGGAFRTQLSTKIGLQTGLKPRWARSWKGLGPSWAALGRLLGALGRLLGSLERFSRTSGLVWGASWADLGPRGHPGPGFWRVWGRPGLDFGRFLRHFFIACCCALRFVT